MLDVLHAQGRAIRRFDLGAGPVSTSGNGMKGPARQHPLPADTASLLSPVCRDERPPVPLPRKRAFAGAMR